MLKPQFPFDPASRFTLLELVVDGAAAANTVSAPAVPPGLNRIILCGHLFHTDDAASHVLGLRIISPSGSGYALPLAEFVAKADLELVPITEPVLVPSGWVLRGVSVDAIPAGKVIAMRFTYIDYLISV